MTDLPPEFMDEWRDTMRYLVENTTLEPKPYDVDAVLYAEAVWVLANLTIITHQYDNPTLAGQLQALKDIINRFPVIRNFTQEQLDLIERLILEARVGLMEADNPTELRELWIAIIRQAGFHEWPPITANGPFSELDDEELAIRVDYALGRLP